MATPIIMPRQGQSVESCIIAKWYKEKGDSVKTGDLLFTYETDKATFDEEAKEDGIILDIFFEEGEDVPVLTNICVIGQEGEDASLFAPNRSTEKETEEDTRKEIEGETEGETERERKEKIKISPRAKNLADKIGINYNFAKPTGPDGRIIEKDIIFLKEEGLAFTLLAVRSIFMFV
jgi:pyruvate dehydrogenase E2 component (dihydrolipoamide acetyltransferase)